MPPPIGEKLFHNLAIKVIFYCFTLTYFRDCNVTGPIKPDD